MSQLTYENRRLTFFRFTLIQLPPSPGSLDRSPQEAYALYFLGHDNTALRIDVLKEKMPESFFTAPEKEKNLILQRLIESHTPYEVLL